jgi:Ca2+-transporting ATPase
MPAKRSDATYTMTVDAIMRNLRTSTKGLSDAEAAKRLASQGRNVLQEQQRESAFVTFCSQFKSVPIFLLAMAAVVSAVLGEHIEAIAIASIIVINALIGFMQERKAGDAIAALRKLTALKVKVLRDGMKQLVDADMLVNGDIIFLESGDKVPADARVIESHSGQVMEASLTGESLPVSKSPDVLSGKHGLGDQRNMVFSGTIVSAGRITAVVTATGMTSEIGKIAKMISDVAEPPSPLKRKIEKMVHDLSIVILGLAFAVFVTLWLWHPGGNQEFFTALITAVAIAVAALPEGLPIVLTITSALGIKRMVKKHILIRRLMSVETLGSVSVICTDKTGTLTKNQMTVRKIYVNGASYDVTGDGYAFEGKLQAPESEERQKLLLCGALCNNASLFEDKVTGDPTEVALLVSAAKSGLSHDDLGTVYPRIAEQEFSSERKLMSTVNTVDKKEILFVKGAADVLLQICTRVQENGAVHALSEDDKARILTATKSFSNEALRVLAFAYREAATDHAEKDLIFLGLQAMIDPPREEVKDAIATCKEAGIKVVMITGDHPDTASAIAKQLGLEVRILNGQELDALDDLDSYVEDIVIYARVNPEHKLRIVTALQRRGHVVAMTGDGVNDAPALKQADIGVAMGITGTDVAKEASQIIVTDDNFASIVGAVEQGRSIYDNIQRFVRYQLSTNVGAVLLIIISIFMALPLPLLPLQLLWINLSIDGPPALSLGLEPSKSSVLKRKPRPRDEPLLTKPLLWSIGLGGVIMALGTLAVFAYYQEFSTYTKATTMAFTTFAFYQFFNVLNCRSMSHSIFKIGLFTNKAAALTVAIAVSLHLVILYTPLASVFHAEALSFAELGICVLVGSTILLGFELKKLFARNVQTS